MTEHNEFTGDPLSNTKGDRKKYEDGWEKIFGGKQSETKHTYKNYGDGNFDEQEKQNESEESKSTS